MPHNIDSRRSPRLPGMDERQRRRSPAGRAGLQTAADSLRARQIEQRWRWPLIAALVGTIPAFYIELLRPEPPWWAGGAYVLAAVVLLAGLAHTAARCHSPWSHVLRNPLDLLLVAGLAASAALPPSAGSSFALGLRLLVAFLILARMVWSLQQLISRGGFVYMLLVAGMILGLCGVGYWWLEPTTPTLADGLWLAFVTAATVGYGDTVPTVAASKIFSVFVVMLGFGVLTMVTAAIATKWVETEERII